ncbi:MAG: signal peptidase II [Clostridiales Family XIII bacterium]|jgi:signal peptidase II|nr:signal peptidase II [Clostridiales Family XIII bacterium]
MSGKKAILIGICIVAFVVASDGVTKALIRANMSLGEAIPSGDAFFSICYALNDGVAFSLFRGHRVPLILIQSALAVVIFAIMLFVLRRSFSFPLLCSFSLMLGGGLGNLSDRIIFGKVTDFISVGSFPIFNVADSALTLGCVLLLIRVLFFEAKNDDRRENRSVSRAE